MTAYVVPLIFLTVLIVAVFKKASPYSSFVQGAAQATDLIKTVLSYLVVVMVAVELFRESGVSAAVARFLSPVFGFFGLPCELCELILIRPLSGAEHWEFFPIFTSCTARIRLSATAPRLFTVRAKRFSIFRAYISANAK